MSNILLVRPSYPDARNSIYRIPIGLLKLGSFHKSKDDTVKYVEGYSFSEDFFPDIIYITGIFTYWSQYTIDSINYYKKKYPLAKVIAGGIYPSISSEHVKNNSLVDEVVVGTIPEVEKFYPDYSLLSTDVPEINDTQIIWTSRGCRRKCEWCFHEDSIVLTDEGHKNIKDIVSSEKYYEVYGDNGKFNRVLEFSSRNYEGDMYEIITHHTNVPILCTPEHLFYILRNDVYQWISAKDILFSDKLLIKVPETIDLEYIDVYEILKYGDYGHTITNQFGKLTKIKPIIEGDNVRFVGGKQRIKRYIRLDEKFMKLAGYYLAEGYCTRSSSRPNSLAGHLSFGSHENNYAEECLGLIKDVFGIETKFYKYKSCLMVRLKSTIASALMEYLFGGNAKGKKIHKIIYSLPSYKLKHLLEGYINGDGCTKGNSIRSATVSKSLAFGIQMIAYKCGYKASVRRYKMHEHCNIIQGRKVVCSPYVYHQYFYTKRNILNSELFRLKVFEYSSYIPIDIQNISVKHHKCKVYNLQVEESPTYTVNNICVHNCAVWKIEPEVYFKNVDDIKKEILHFSNRKNVILYDNSIMQHPELERLLNMFKYWHDRVGFRYSACQGIDGRMMMQWEEKGVPIAKLMKSAGFYDLRFSYDHKGEKESVYYCVNKFEEAGYKRKDMQIFCIINNIDSPDIVEDRYWEIYSQLGCQVHSDRFRPENAFSDNYHKGGNDYFINSKYGWTNDNIRGTLSFMSGLNYATRMGILYTEAERTQKASILNKGKSSRKMNEFM